MPMQHSTRPFFFRPTFSLPTNLRLFLGLLSLALGGMLGCSSSDPEPTAADPAAVVPMPTIVMDKDKNEGQESSGEAYGSGAYSSDADNEVAGLPSMEMTGIGPYGEGGPKNFSMSGYPGGPEDDGTGMMMGMPGYGMAGDTTPQFASAMQFVRTNCMNCHGPQQTKGDLRLDVVSDDFTNTSNATIWHSVLEQLENDTMPPPSVTRRPEARQQSAVVTWIRSALVKSDFVPLEDRDYLSQANYAFGVGEEGRAVELLYAQAVAADNDVAQETLSQARWFELGLRPVLALRFAVGVDLDAPDDIDDLKPLGVSQNGNTGGGRGAASMGMERPSRTGANTKSERTLQELTGDFGNALADSFESRWTGGLLGTPFKDVEPPPPPRSRQ